MATNFTEDSEDQLRTRKGHDMTWSCATSGYPITHFCNEDKVPLCQPCALNNHQKHCSLELIGDVISERREQLERKMTELEGEMPSFEEVEAQIKSCKAFLATHLQTVYDEADRTYEGKLKSVIEADREDIRVIKQEADEEMRPIIKKRDKRLKERQEKTKQQRRDIEDTKQKLTKEREEIDKLVRKQITALENKNKLAIDKLKSINQKMKEIKKTDKELVNGAPQAIASIDETLSVNIAQKSVECLQKIQRDIKSVEFVKCTRYGQKHYGRIHEDIGKWEKVKERDIPYLTHFALMYLPGLVSDDEVCVFSDDTGTFAIDIANEHAKTVISDSPVTSSCAPLNSNMIVCGHNYRRVILYDRTRTPWKVVWDIKILTSPQYSYSSVDVDRDRIDSARLYGRSDISVQQSLIRRESSYVDVDSDGMILAGVDGQSDIHVINPANGRVLQTITIQGSEINEGIRSLSSGNIMVGTKSGAIIISRSGEVVSRVSRRSRLDDQRLVTSSGDKVDIGYKDRTKTVMVYRRSLGV